MKRLHLLLAPKERFEPTGAGAFALNVVETSRVSRWRSGITVFGSPVAQPFPDVRFRALAAPRWPLPNRNVAFARRYLHAAKHEAPDLIEIFNRPVMVIPIKRHLGDVPVAVHFGNDPRGMDGSRTAGERRNLAKAAHVICVSEFIRDCFVDGTESVLGGQVHVVHTGVEAAKQFPGAKTNRIVYVGRVVPEKGVLELVEALAQVLPRHPAWTAHIIGARWFGGADNPGTYERAVFRAASRCERIHAEGFLPHDDVIALLREASIAVVPSRWDDPFPRSALEALAHGAALICSARGGIPEIGRDRALFLDEISAESLADALDRLVSNDDERHALQRRGWEGLPFEIRRTTQKLDDLRARIMGIV